MGNTPNRNYPLPVAANNISDDVAKLQTAVSMVDGDVDALLTAISGLAPIAHAHAIADVTGLQGALDGKAAYNHVHSLDNLTDVTGAAGAADGYVLVKSPSGYVPSSPVAALGVHGHTIAQVTGLQAALDAKASGASLAALEAGISGELDGKAGLLDVRRNRIVNGCMQISQENGNTAGTTAGYYAADQFYVSFSTSAGAVSFQRAQEVTPAGAKDRLRLSVTTVDAGLGAAEFLLISTIIEGSKLADLEWGTPNAKPAIFRFFGSFPDQVMCIAFRDPSNSVSFVHEIDPAAANTDEVFEITVPGPTTGTWPSGDVAGLYIGFTVASGSTYTTPTTDAWVAGNFVASTGIANGLASNTNVFEIGDVGLRADPEGAGVYGQFEVPDKDQAREECMRYYQTTRAFFWGDVTSANDYRAFGTLPVIPRSDIGILSGTHVVSNGFPGVVGTLGIAAQNSVTDLRTASSTKAGGYFYTNIILNVRM